MMPRSLYVRNTTAIFQSRTQSILATRSNAVSNKVPFIFHKSFIDIHISHKQVRLPPLGGSRACCIEMSISCKCQSLTVTASSLFFLILSQEVIQVLDNIKIHRPERQGRLSVTCVAVDPSCVYSTHLEMAQMKSMETEHLYLGASS